MSSGSAWKGVLRASEENFRTLARAMPNHVWTSPPDGMLDWFNEQVYAFSGAEAGTVALRDWINERLAARYQRGREVVVLDALPRNIAGKTLKRELRERYLAARAG